MFLVQLFRKAVERIKSLPDNTSKSKEQQVVRDLVHQEATLGGKLFGSTPANKRRDFFCYNENTWVWHESVENSDGTQKIVTTRYEVRPEGIVKIQDNKPHVLAGYEESLRLLKAAAKYKNLVNKHIYSRL